MRLTGIGPVSRHNPIRDKEVDAMNITRLEFRSDLKRGDKKRIWMALAKMLRAGGKDRSVMTVSHEGQDTL